MGGNRKSAKAQQSSTRYSSSGAPSNPVATANSAEPTPNTTESPPPLYNRSARPLYFFRASEPRTGFLSNWYASEPFTDCRRIPVSSSSADPPHDTVAAEAEAGAGEIPEVKVYKTSEHYMMHHKALLFGDADTAAEILRVAHPHKAQSIGRLVDGFDPAVWERERLGIVSDAIYWKFTSPLSAPSSGPASAAAAETHRPAGGFGNEQQGGVDYSETGEREKEWRLADSSRAQTVRARGFRAALLATGDRLLVEASPFDRTWGIGVSAKEADAKRELWGLNLLGQCLMDVRERFREEERNS
ncbi:hypothetical protein SLS62_010735 [Diatrype stigma]|uniref:NADAR domain-containing protein n=1 Tax=Diatrype stigma TaxID=117547 RepID=A0AAN9U8Q4_9PEZI